MEDNDIFSKPEIGNRKVDMCCSQYKTDSNL